MYILAIETTGAFCSVAILDKNREDKLWEETGTEKMNHVKNLIPMIENLMEREKIDFDKISHIAVSNGPGSFTGLRIGVSTGRAISQATNKPLIAVPTLEAFVQGYLNSLKNKGEDTRGSYQKQIICPIFDARRMQVYGGAYTVDLAKNIFDKELVLGGAYMLEEFLTEVYTKQKIMEHKGKVVFVGDGLKSYEKEIREWANKENIEIETLNIFQKAGGVATRAKQMLDLPEQFHDKINLSYKELKPNYMRKAEAQRKLEEARDKEKETIRSIDKISIREAKLEDAEAIEKVERRSFQDPWALESFQKELGENKLAKYMVCDIDGEIVAYMGLWQVGNEGHITNIAVHPQYRRHKIGTMMVKATLEMTEAMGIDRHTLEVRHSNVEARDFYKKLGFVEVGARPRYYLDNGEDAIIMWRVEGI